MNSYKDRFIGFIDIIGFKNIIKKSKEKHSEISINSIKEALTFKEPIDKDKLILGGVGDISESNHIMTTFSDNILISVEANRKGFFNILNHAERIGFELLNMNILCRGGITKGKIYHDQQFVFGPGLIDAHKLESEKAQRPRIILDDKMISFKNSLHSNGKKLFDRFTKKDKRDNYFFVDILRTLQFQMQQIAEPPNDAKELVISIKNYLKNEIQKNKDDSEITEKLSWFLEYLHDSTNREFIDRLSQPFNKRNNAG